MTPEERRKYEQAMREFQAEIDAWPLLNYGVTPTKEQVARDNARERRRLGIDPPEEAEQP